MEQCQVVIKEFDELIKNTGVHQYSNPYYVLKPSYEVGNTFDLVNQAYVDVCTDHLIDNMERKLFIDYPWGLIEMDNVVLVDVEGKEFHQATRLLKHYGLSLLALRQLVFYEILSSIAIKIIMMGKSTVVYKCGTPISVKIPVPFVQYVLEMKDYIGELGVKTTMIQTFINYYMF